MILRTPGKTSWKNTIIRCSQRGAFIALKWEQWSSSGAPFYDPTTGAQLTDASYLMEKVNAQGQPIVQLNPQGTWNYLVTTNQGNPPTQPSLRTRAWTHFVGPTQSRARIFAEIKEGDCIMDFVIPLVQIASPGDTSFYVGQIVDIFQFGATNRALASGQTLATVFPGNVNVESFQNPAVWIYRSKWDWEHDINGEEWVQQAIGKDLAQSWATLYIGELMGEAMLLRKAT
jgi:hypothetical protein